MRLRPTVEGDFGRTLLTRVAKKFNILVTCRISMCNFVSAQDKASVAAVFDSRRVYRVTIPLVQNLPLTSEQQFHFGLA